MNWQFVMYQKYMKRYFIMKQRGFKCRGSGIYWYWSKIDFDLTWLQKQIPANETEIWYIPISIKHGGREWYLMMLY